jgi:DNA-binding transcriptional MerR regulator
LEGYSAEQASRVTGADYHNILYWLRSGLIQASYSPHRQPKPRHPIRFSFTDLLEIGIIQELRERGAPVQRVRKALHYLKSLGPVYTALFHHGASLPKELRHKAVYLDVSGDDIRVYHSDKEVVTAVMQPGQKVIHLLIIDVKRVRDELRTQLGHSEELEKVTAAQAAFR